MPKDVVPAFSASALSVPALMLVLVAFEVQPPRWMITPPRRVAAAAIQATPTPRREVPTILAVDERIERRLRQLRPAVRKRLAQVARRLPKRVKLLVTSAYRTREEQAGLRPTFGVKARPGRSPHEDGRAIDLNVLVDGKRISPRRNKAVIGKLMADAGFKYLGHHDPVHFSVPKHIAHDETSSAPSLDIMTMEEVDAHRELEALEALTPAADQQAENSSGLLAEGFGPFGPAALP